MSDILSGRVGLALGSGAARGWCHIGVIRGLEAAGIVPSVIAGTSVGSVVGAAYAAGRLDEFEEWVLGLQGPSVLRNLDISFRGGLIKAAQFFQFMSSAIPDGSIEELPRRFAAVATDLETGREIWIRKGSIHEALRASVALPGLITPARLNGRWLVDGGLVNPVPISVCRAMGADSVVAVDLNASKARSLGLGPAKAEATAKSTLPATASGEEETPDETEASLATIEGLVEGGAAELNRLRRSIESWARELRTRLSTADDAPREQLPSLFEVLGNSINIMQVQISRSRMAGDPPELLVLPQLNDFELLDLDRGAEAIEEGRRAILRALAPVA